MLVVRVLAKMSTTSEQSLLFVNALLESRVTTSRIRGRKKAVDEEKYRM